MEFDKEFIDVNLERFDPAQFEKSFSVSEESSIADVSIVSNDTDKGLLKELECIQKVVGAIENHLLYKNIVIKSTVYFSHNNIRKIPQTPS